MNDNKNEESIDLFLEKLFSGKLDLDSKDIDIRQKLTAIVQHLIDQNFPALIQLLYKIDVSEQMLKSKLINGSIEQSTDIVVDAIWTRLTEKLRTRNQYRQRPEDIPEDERW